MVFYADSGGVLVNLYTEAEARVPLTGGNGVNVTQKTDYPSSGAVEILLAPDRPASFPVSLRIPKWCPGAEVLVNRRAVEAEPSRGRLLRIERIWSPGDTISLSLPMAIRLVRGRRAQTGRVAVMRGPQVFCLSRGEADTRTLVIDPSSLAGPVRDERVRPGGVGLGGKAWSAEAWYPVEAPDRELALSEFPDPAGEAVYFKVPVPDDPRFCDDELLAGGRSVADADYYGELLGRDLSDRENAEILARLQS
jgi:hypothetical protein